VLALLVGGSALCFTSMVIGWRVLRRYCEQPRDHAIDPIVLLASACGARVAATYRLYVTVDYRDALRSWSRLSLSSASPNIAAIPKQFLKLSEGRNLPEAECRTDRAPAARSCHHPQTDDRPFHRLTTLGIRSLEVERGSLPSLYTMIEKIGDATGTSPRARELTSAIQARLTAVSNRSRNLPGSKVLFVVGRKAGTLSDIVVVGTDSYLNDLIELRARAMPCPIPHYRLSAYLT